MKNKISKYIMLLVGLVILLVSAVSYIFDLGFKHSALTILGLVFVVVGRNIARKK